MIARDPQGSDLGVSPTFVTASILLQDVYWFYDLERVQTYSH